MARSFYKPESIATAPPFLHEPSKTWYAMERRDGGQLVQRRWRVDPDGKQIHVRELTVDQVMGSGNHARSFLHETPRGGLLELPLAWYPENGGTWAMSPGHDRDRTLPPRAVAYECMFCHNAYPQIPARHEEPGAEPLYTGALPQGIDCQRCHGPGDAHVAKAQAGHSIEQVRAAIVNPARLSGDRQMEVCMQCHLETTALPLPHSLVKFGRGPFSYTPAEPLGDFMNFFDHAPGGNHEDDFEIAHSAYRLRKSKCFLGGVASGNVKKQMTCTTCHNPHDVPRGEQATTQYNAVCGTCHASLPVTHTKASDCISCHMPKRRTQDVIHAVMTDHFIQRRPTFTEPLKERDALDYRGEVVNFYPPKGDPLLAAVAQVAQRSNVSKGLPRLASEAAKQRRHEPYIELGQAWLGAGKAVQAIGPLEEALRRKPDSVAAILSLGDALTQAGQAPRAITVLTRGTQIAGDEPLLWYQLGLAQSKAGRPAEAETALAKAAALDPDSAEVPTVLGGLYASRGDIGAAETQFQTALAINPDFPGALADLGQLLGIRGKMTESIYYLDRAATVNPRSSDVRINYAVALASLGQLQQAEQQIEAALQLVPNAANAHFISGAILEKIGRRDQALAAFERALRLRPGYPAALQAVERLSKAKAPR